MTALTVAPVPVPVLRRRPIPLSEPRPALRVVPHERPAPLAQGTLALHQDDTGHAEGGVTAPGQGAPPAGSWTRQFVQAALEVSAGRRRPTQLVRWTSDDVFQLLSRRWTLAQRNGRQSDVTAVSVVRSVHLCRPRGGIVEASAVVVDRGRVRAVALRLEEVADRWRVTALEVG